MNRFLELRKQLGYSQKQLADVLYVNQTAVSQWERGITTPSPNTLFKLCEIYGVTTDYLLGREQETNETVRGKEGNWVPVLGDVRAGLPIEAIEEVLDWEELTPEMASQGEHIGLRIVGDSMEPKMSAGDVVIVHLQPDLENGEIGIVLVNGDTATVKKVIKQDSGLLLVAFNSSVYEPKFYTNEDIANLPITILGKVVELRAKF